MTDEKKIRPKKAKTDPPLVKSIVTWDELYQRIYADKPVGAHAQLDRTSSVVMTYNCTCGMATRFYGHYQFDFFQCPSCNKKYALSVFMSMKELNQNEVDFLVNMGISKFLQKGT